MNWTGGQLNRHSRKSARDKVTDRQKQYFAKARLNPQTEPPLSPTHFKPSFLEIDHKYQVQAGDPFTTNTSSSQHRLDEYPSLKPVVDRLQRLSSRTQLPRRRNSHSTHRLQGDLSAKDRPLSFRTREPFTAFEGNSRPPHKPNKELNLVEGRPLRDVIHDQESFERKRLSLLRKSNWLDLEDEAIPTIQDCRRLYHNVGKRRKITDEDRERQQSKGQRVRIPSICEPPNNFQIGKYNDTSEYFPIRSENEAPENQLASGNAAMRHTSLLPKTPRSQSLMLTDSGTPSSIFHYPNRSASSDHHWRVPQGISIDAHDPFGLPQYLFEVATARNALPPCERLEAVQNLDVDDDDAPQAALSFNHRAEVPADSDLWTLLDKLETLERKPFVSNSTLHSSNHSRTRAGVREGMHRKCETENRSPEPSSISTSVSRTANHGSGDDTMQRSVLASDTTKEYSRWIEFMHLESSDDDKLQTDSCSKAETQRNDASIFAVQGMSPNYGTCQSPSRCVQGENDFWKAFVFGSDQIDGSLAAANRVSASGESDILFASGRAVIASSSSTPLTTMKHLSGKEVPENASEVAAYYSSSSDPLASSNPTIRVHRQRKPAIRFTVD